MPIYAYKCSACAHGFDTLQKVSEAPLSVCPRCGAAALAKQLTAAGFQLKGSGWYATDFKNPPAPPEAAAKSEAKSDAAPVAQPAGAPPAAAPAPAGPAAAPASGA